MADQNINNMSVTWNAGGTTFDFMKVNVTDTASAAASLLQNFQVGGVAKWTVKKDGSITAAAGATIGGNSTITGTLGVTGAFTAAAIAGTTGTFSGAISGTTGTFTGVVTHAVGAVGAPSLTFTGDSNTGLYWAAADHFAGTAGGTETWRTSSTGFYVGLTAPGVNTPGVTLFKTGLIQHTVTNNIALQSNRTNDGVVAQWGSAGTYEGNISISGTTCTYGTFFGSHISQLLGGAARIEILRGSIVATVDEMSVWGIVEYVDHNGDTVRDEGAVPAGGKIGDVFDLTYQRMVPTMIDVPAEYFEGEEQAFDEVETTIDDVEIRDGRAYRVQRTSKQRVYLFDEMQLFNDAGEPVMRLVQINEGAAPTPILEKVQIPRMVKVRRLVSEAGRVVGQKPGDETVKATVVLNNNIHLPRFKVCDTAGCERPYGVFGWWDDDDKAHTADAVIGALGTYVVRIKSGHVVAGGDLIQSSDVEGCGMVLDDETLSAISVKKRHVATITAAIPQPIYPTGPIHYPDGSYIVPCTLHCG